MLTKGGLFLRVREYTLVHHGHRAWSELLAALPPDDATEVSHVLAVGHYDTWLLSRVYRALEAALSTADPRVLEHFGAWTAEQDLTTTYRLFLRMANPAYVFEKSGSYWGRFHDAGQWLIERRGAASAVGTLTGFIGCEVFCRTLVPYIRRMFELVGAQAVHVEHPTCRGRGGEACVFDIRWKG